MLPKIVCKKIGIFYKVLLVDEKVDRNIYLPEKNAEYWRKRRK
jgi:hypothetical protein